MSHLTPYESMKKKKNNIPKLLNNIHIIIFFYNTLYNYFVFYAIIKEQIKNQMHSCIISHELWFKISIPGF